jgi:hypothetical protein
VGLKQISGPNKAQSSFISDEYVAIMVQPLHKTIKVLAFAIARFRPLYISLETASDFSSSTNAFAVLQSLQKEAKEGIFIFRFVPSCSEYFYLKIGEFSCPHQLQRAYVTVEVQNRESISLTLRNT